MDVDKVEWVLAGWLVDGTGGPIRQTALIQVLDGQIALIRRVRPEDLASFGKPVLDLSACTVLPGLVDSHVHLTMSGTGDETVRERQLSFAFDEARGVIREHLKEQLARGVVMVRDGGDAAAHALTFKDEELSRLELPVSFKASGKAWRAKGRYGRLIGRPPGEGKTLAQAITDKGRIADHVKIVNAGLNSLKEFGRETAPQFSGEELGAALQAARRLGLKTMVHANGRIPVRDAVDGGCTSIEHGFFMGRENIERMAELQVTWVPTAVTMKAYSEQLPRGSMEAEIAERIFEHQVEQMTVARRWGVPMAVGTDSGSLGVNHGLALIEELKIFMACGFSLEEAIGCSSLEGARLLGVKGEMGQLKKGMDATFVAVNGDPSMLPDALKEPVQVFVKGEPVRA
ncbi:MAG: amidohydrolase family protein [Syntrophobacteraceae bacterium]